MFSPDGRTLAWRAQSRAGYESDRWDVMVRDLRGGRDRRLTLRADASPSGDRPAGGPASTQQITVRNNVGEKYDRIVGYKLGPLPEPILPEIHELYEEEVPF